MIHWKSAAVKGYNTTYATLFFKKGIPLYTRFSVCEPCCKKRRGCPNPPCIPDGSGCLNCLSIVISPPVIPAEIYSPNACGCSLNSISPFQSFFNSCLEDDSYWPIGIGNIDSETGELTYNGLTIAPDKLDLGNIHGEYNLGSFGDACSGTNQLMIVDFARCFSVPCCLPSKFCYRVGEYDFLRRLNNFVAFPIQPSAGVPDVGGTTTTGWYMDEAEVTYQKSSNSWTGSCNVNAYGLKYTSGDSSYNCNALHPKKFPIVGGCSINITPITGYFNFLNGESQQPGYSIDVIGYGDFDGYGYSRIASSFDICDMSRGRFPDGEYFSPFEFETLPCVCSQIPQPYPNKLSSTLVGHVCGGATIPLYLTRDTYNAALLFYDSSSTDTCIRGVPTIGGLDCHKSCGFWQSESTTLSSGSFTYLYTEPGFPDIAVTGTALYSVNYIFSMRLPCKCSDFEDGINATVARGMTFVEGSFSDNVYSYDAFGNVNGIILPAGKNTCVGTTHCYFTNAISYDPVKFDLQTGFCPFPGFYCENFAIESFCQYDQKTLFYRYCLLWHNTCAKDVCLYPHTLKVTE
jgi:hypothetical protein